MFKRNGLKYTSVPINHLISPEMSYSHFLQKCDNDSGLYSLCWWSCLQHPQSISSDLGGYIKCPPKYVIMPYVEKENNSHTRKIEIKEIPGRARDNKLKNTFKCL